MTLVMTLLSFLVIDFILRKENSFFHKLKTLLYKWNIIKPKDNKNDVVYCCRCGTAVATGKNFCPSCGHKINEGGNTL